MDEELYDEFGNCIGKEKDLLENVSDDEYDDNNSYDENGNDSDDIEIKENKNLKSDNNELSNYIKNIQKFDKDDNIIKDNIDDSNNNYEITEYNKDYGDDDIIIERINMQEDSQPLTTPIIESNNVKKYDFQDNNVDTNFDFDYLASLSTSSKLFRNLAIVGNLHHGKTSFIDLFVNHTHNLKKIKNDLTIDNKELYNKQDFNKRYLDSRVDEQLQGLTIKSKPISLVLKDAKGKSRMITFLDTPGHPNFSDEISNSLRAVEGVVFVVDIIEGILNHTKNIIKEVIKQDLDIILVINKIDRLVLELKLPPKDAYFKIKHTIDEFNLVIQDNLIFNPFILNNTDNSDVKYRSNYVHPVNGNVFFSSSSFNILFSLESFFANLNKRHCNKINNNIKNEKNTNRNTDTNTNSNTTNNNINFNSDENFYKMCWGDLYYNHKSKKFSSDVKDSTYKVRSFVEFILEPIYKLFGYTISLNIEELNGFLSEVGVQLSKKELLLNPDELLKSVFKYKFLMINHFVDKIFQHVLEPSEANIKKINFFYTGNRKTDFYNRITSIPNRTIVNTNVVLNNKQNDHNEIKINSKIDGGKENENNNTEILENIQNNDQSNIIQIKDKPLLIFVFKMYHDKDYKSFSCLGKILSGQISKDDNVDVLGEFYTPNKKEDKSSKIIKNLFIYQSRYKVEINKMYEGNIVLIEGVDEYISKSATIVNSMSFNNMKNINSPLNNISNEGIQSISVLKPIDYFNFSYFKINIEPIIPSELPKMIDGLLRINKSYPLCKIKVEETGEHIITGTGEMYMNCIMHDLRVLYSEIEIKISDPCVVFQETVFESSQEASIAESSNLKNSISILAEPMEEGLENDIQLFNLMNSSNRGLLSNILENDYKWELLEIDNIWAFEDKLGTDNENYNTSKLQDFSSNIISNKYNANTSFNGINLLVNYTLPFKTDQSNLYNVKNFIETGFQWACNEGPLIEEPIRNVKFKIIEAGINNEPCFRSGGQIMPMVRKACHNSVLLASPRLMEPILKAEIITPSDCESVITQILSRRRGHIDSFIPKPGTSFYIMIVTIPALDSFGFEVDIRNLTAGMSFVTSYFDHWGILPGDPLDKEILIKNLEPSVAPHLARECLIKTRKRKGLNENVRLLN